MATKNVFDIAAFIISQKHPLPTLRLHKLLYYCQAWSLVWDEKPLFGQSIYARNKSAQWIRDLITMEKPWRDARKGLDDREGGGREITLASMAEYYEGVYNEGFEIEA